MMSRRLAWLAPVALLLAACGGGKGPARARAEPGTVTLDLRPARGSAPLAPRRTVARYDVLREQPNWVLRAGQWKHETLAAETRREAQHVMTVWGGVGESDLLEVRIPGRFTPTDINRVVVSALIPDERTLQAALIRGGRRIVIARGVVVTGEPGFREVVLDLVGSGEREPCDHLSVSISGAGEAVQIASIELAREPMATTLPPLDAPELIEIGGEWKRVAGLSSRHPLECSLRARTGAELFVDYGLPPYVRLPGSVRELRAIVSSASGLEHVYHFPFEYEEVVQYSKRPVDIYREEKRMKAELAKVRDPAARKVRKENIIRKGQEKTPDEAFAARAPKEPEKPTFERDTGPPKTGLMDEWVAASIPLRDFADEDIVVRFELVESGIAESVCAIARPRLAITDPAAPSVVIVTVDALRADHVGLGAADARVDTPWIDKLAERGVVFESAWAPSNGQLASHAALHTGVSPRDTRLLQTGQMVPDEVVTLAEIFREAGWVTAAVVSSGSLAPDLSGLGQGFEHVFAPRGSERDVEKTLEDLRLALSESRGLPRFIWLHLHDPDGPYAPPGKYRTEIIDKKRDPYAADLPDPDRAPPEWDPSVRDLEYVESLYAAEVAFVDRKLRPILDHPLLKSGYIAVTGTYAESLETFDHKRLTPETLHVPLIVAGPDLPKGARISRPVEIVSLGRTLLDLVGLVDVPFTGDTLRGPEQALDETDSPRFAFSVDGGTAAIVQNGLLLTLCIRGVPGVQHTVELFDVQADPIGRENLARERPADVRELRGRLVAWLSDARETSPPQPLASDQQVARWREKLQLPAVGLPRGAGPWIEPDCRCEACAAVGSDSE
jgi:arylsulfatase A-like enzyme